MALCRIRSAVFVGRSSISGVLTDFVSPNFYFSSIGICFVRGGVGKIVSPKSVMLQTAILMSSGSVRLSVRAYVSVARVLSGIRGVPVRSP